MFVLKLSGIQIEFIGSDLFFYSKIFKANFETFGYKINL